MNVRFDMNSTGDVAKMLGVTPAVIASWCRLGVISFSDVSEPGSARPRYMFTDDEVTRVMNLRGKYGKAWMRHAKETVVPQVDKVIEAPKPQLAYIKELSDEAKKRRESVDKLADKIERVRDLKEELNDIEARRNQLLREIELIKNEIFDEI